MPANVVTAYYSKDGFSKTKALHQWDYGQILKLADFCLPETYEVHFSNDQSSGKSTTSIGDANGAEIPDIYLTTGRDVFAWLYHHSTDVDGETVYTIQIPVIRRAKIENKPPTPVQQDAITQAIAALNNATGKAEKAAKAAEEFAATAESSADEAVDAQEKADEAAKKAEDAWNSIFEALLSGNLDIDDGDASDLDDNDSVDDLDEGVDDEI